MALEYVGTFELTNSQLDRHSQRVLTKGVDIEPFLSNPIMLWNHIRSVSSGFSDGKKDIPLPIGRWDNVKKLAKSIRADAYIDMEDPFAAEIGRKIKLGIINAVSVGLKYLSVSDDPKDKLPGQKYETILTSELREASPTDIPANASTLKLKTDLSKSLENGNAKDADLFLVKMAYKSPEANKTITEAPEQDTNIELKSETKMKLSRFVELVNKQFGTVYSNDEDAQKHVEEHGLPEVKKTDAPLEEVKEEIIDEAIVDEVKTEEAAPAVPTEENLNDEPANEAQAEKSEGVSKDDFEAFKKESNEAIANLGVQMKDFVKDLMDEIKSLSDANEAKAAEVEEVKNDTEKELNELKSLLNKRKSLKSGVKADSQNAPVIETKSDDDKGTVKSANNFVADYLGGKIVTNK